MTREEALSYAAALIPKRADLLREDGDYEVTTLSGTEELTVRIVRRRDNRTFATLVEEIAKR